MHRFTTTCARGLEDLLAEELAELGIPAVRIGDGALGFDGELRDAYRACLWSRIASRVLLPLRNVYAGSIRAYYAELRRIRWADHLRTDRTLAVSFVGTSPAFQNSHFGALKTKDAIIDSLRDDVGERPDISPKAPDLRVHVYLSGQRATVSLDLSGPPLHQRGYDRDGGPAPLKESLAAAILRMAGWQTRGPEGLPVFDPMCGSGTFLLEAADVLRDHAPGLERLRWGFTSWKQHEENTWRQLIEEARERVRPLATHQLFAADGDPDQLARAMTNFERAGVGGHVTTTHRMLEEMPSMEDPGLLVTNPPYGARLGTPDEVRLLWKTLGNVLRRRLLGWDAWILCGDPVLAKSLGLRPRRRIPVFNGPLECRVLHVPISERPVARDAPTS